MNLIKLIKIITYIIDQTRKQHIYHVYIYRINNEIRKNKINPENLIKRVLLK